MTSTEPVSVSDEASPADAPLLVLTGSKTYRTTYGFQLRVRSDTVRLVSSCCGQSFVCSGPTESVRCYCANCSTYCFTADAHVLGDVPVRQSQAALAALIGAHTCLEPLALELAAYDLATALEAAQ